MDFTQETKKIIEYLNLVYGTSIPTMSEKVECILEDIHQEGYSKGYDTAVNEAEESL